MNPKRRVCKIINFQKAGVMLWQSTVLYWDFDTELHMYPARCKPLTSTKHRKPRLEFAKQHKRWARRVLELCLWTDEKNFKWSQAYSLICKAWWRCCHGMGMYTCLWNRSSQLYWWLNIWWQQNEFGRVQNQYLAHWTLTQNNPASSVKEFITLRLPKSISRFKSDWTWISPAEEESKGRNSPKQATIRIGWIKGWEKHFKGWDQESGDVYASQTHCCNCARDLQLKNSF